MKEHKLSMAKAFDPCGEDSRSELTDNKDEVWKVGWGKLVK